MSTAATYLFYSNSCKHCRDLMQGLRGTAVLSTMKLICVDRIDHEKLPNYVKSVPTLKLGANVLVGEVVFRWCNQAIKKQSNTKEIPASSSSSSQNRTCALPPKASGGGTQEGGEIEGWRDNEWGSGSLTDSYSFIGDCPDGLCRNFQLLDELEPPVASPAVTASPNSPALYQQRGNLPYSTAPSVDQKEKKVQFMDRGAPADSQRDNEDFAQRLESLKMQRELF